MRWYDGLEPDSIMIATLVSTPLNFGEVIFGQFDVMDDGCGYGESFPKARLKLESRTRLPHTELAGYSYFQAPRALFVQVLCIKPWYLYFLEKFM